MKTVRAGKTYYAWFVFTNVNGEEITRDAVELCPSVEQIGTVLPCGKISVSQAETVTIETGNIRYVFSPQTGQLISAEAQDKQLITDLRPIIWSPLDPCEKSAFGKENVRKAVDLNQYTTSVKEWSYYSGKSGLSCRFCQSFYHYLSLFNRCGWAFGCKL